MAPEKTCKKTKIKKVSILATKTQNMIRKIIANNKASRQLHIKKQKAKKIQTNTQILAHNTYQNTVHSAKAKQAKKNITLI